MAEEGFDAYLVTSGVSIFYFSHFYHMVTERPAALLVEPDGKPVFMGPRLEADHLELQTPLIGDCYTYLDYPGEKHPMQRFKAWITELGYAKAQGRGGPHQRVVQVGQPRPYLPAGVHASRAL
jgi:Xaa-Pro aminopeptidase